MVSSLFSSEYARQDTKGQVIHCYNVSGIESMNCNFQSTATWYQFPEAHVLRTAAELILRVPLLRMNTRYLVLPSTITALRLRKWTVFYKQ
jgi:hypothetical protein